MSDPAVPTIQVDNARIRVTEWRFAPQAVTGFHTHAFDYVVVPLTTGRLKAVLADGSVTTHELRAGVSYFREAGVAHDIVNDNSHEFVFIEVEIKPPAGPGAD